jgi:hypothetical protein
MQARPSPDAAPRSIGGRSSTTSSIAELCAAPRFAAHRPRTPRVIVVRSLGLIALFVPLLTAATCRRNQNGQPPRTQQIFLTVSGLLPLNPTQGFYELWLGSPAQPPPAGTQPWDVPQRFVSAATFRVDTLGVMQRLDGARIETLPLPAAWDGGDVARALITYQIVGQESAPHAPGFKLAAGSFVAPGFIQSTELSAEDGEVAPLDLRALAGDVTLATPTTSDPNDELLGAWFFRGEVAAPQPSLALGQPGALPDSLTFQGWLLERSETGAIRQMLPMGRFRSATGVDSDGGGPAAGTVAAPPFPGQDFNTQLPTGIPFLRNPEIMITLEPALDPAPGLPSSLRVLRRGIDARTASHVALAMSNSAQDGLLPHAAITVQR